MPKQPLQLASTAVKWVWRGRFVVIGVLGLALVMSLVLQQLAQRQEEQRVAAEKDAWRAETAISESGGMGRSGYFDVADIRQGVVLDGEYALIGEITTAPLLMGEVLVVGTKVGLVAINAETLQEKWTAGIGQIDISPLVSNEAVYASALSQLGNETYLFKLDLSSGEVLWKTKHNSYGAVDPLLVGGHVVIKEGMDQLIALDSRTGALAWQLKSDTYVFTELAAVGGRILVGTREELWLVSAEDGSILARREVQMDVNTNAVSDGKNVYLSSGDGYVYAYNGDLSQQLWKHWIEQEVDEGTSTAGGYQELAKIILTGEQVILTRSYFGPHFTALESKTGEILWVNAPIDEDAGSYLPMGVVASRGQFYMFNAEDGTISAYELGTGKRLWLQRTYNQALKGVTLGDGALYAAEPFGHVLVFVEGYEEKSPLSLPLSAPLTAPVVEATPLTEVSEETPTQNDTPLPVNTAQITTAERWTDTMLPGFNVDIPAGWESTLKPFGQADSIGLNTNYSESCDEMCMGLRLAKSDTRGEHVTVELIFNVAMGVEGSRCYTEYPGVKVVGEWVRFPGNNVSYFYSHNAEVDVVHGSAESPQLIWIDGKEGWAKGETYVYCEHFTGPVLQEAPPSTLVDPQFGALLMLENPIVIGAPDDALLTEIDQMILSMQGLAPRTDWLQPLP